MAKTPEKEEEIKQNAKRKHSLVEEEETEAKKMSSETAFQLKSTPRTKSQESSDEEEEEEDKKMKSETIFPGEYSEIKFPETSELVNARFGDEKNQRFGYSFDGEILSRFPDIKKILGCIEDCTMPFEQKIVKTDVDKLILSRDEVKSRILPLLKKSDLKGGGGIVVKVYDEFSKSYKMMFKFIDDQFMLCTRWKYLFEDHKLNENGDCYAAVWMFRHKRSRKRCFAVIMKTSKTQD
ncbi:putative B3 domain-containing protein At4g03170 [Solanum tuberosum]|uniref:putative B3 domain-containing protein At4g03170 n=1 Tax=Solanum tuberosum TaxID=4113 RepID=UPI00073A0521|nr:PREDICTED: putative B3 domain-containing protein At4g03170 [Solanum tuberosum]